jgi:hypothetical protein
VPIAAKRVRRLAVAARRNKRAVEHQQVREDALEVPIAKVFEVIVLEISM